MPDTDRYRLVEQLPDIIPNTQTQTWLGADLTLDRAVTIRLTEIDSEPGQRLRLQTQSLASLEHPGLLHILDSYTAGRQLAIVTERLPEHSLADELDGHFPRLTAGEALRAAAAAAEALQALHEAGFAHGGISASQIGRRREGGFILMTGPPTADAVKIPATRRDDVRGLVALAYELLVGAPPNLRPNDTMRIGAAVPAAARTIFTRANSDDNPWHTAGDLVAAFREAEAEVLARESERRRRGRGGLGRGGLGGGGFRRPAALVAGAVVALGLLAGAGWVVWQRGSGEASATGIEAGTDSGTVTDANADGANSEPRDAGTDGNARPGNEPEAESGSGTSPGDNSGNNVDNGSNRPPTQPEITRVPVEITQITDFDPFGVDTIEHPELLLSLNDGDSQTGWRTSLYNTSQFGGLKEGVGLIVSLGGEEVPDLARVVIESPNTGWSFQLLASQERRSSQITNWGEPVADQLVTSTRAGPIVLNFDSLRAATLLLWITDLGAELPAGGHRVTITGIRVSRYHTP